MLSKATCRLIRTIRKEYNFGTSVVRIIQGDLTEEIVDCLVNAANSQLKHGGGVAGAIARKGGPQVQKESYNYAGHYGDVPEGEVAVTKGGNLNCQYIIHAVGPVYKDGNQGEPGLLLSAIWNSLLKCEELGVQSIAFPAISSGIFGYPKDQCAKKFVEAIEAYLKAPPIQLKDIRLVNLDSLTVETFIEVFDKEFMTKSEF